MSVTVNIGDALTHGHGLLRLPRMTQNEFWEFCLDNPTLQVERNADGDIILMAPADGWTESRNNELQTDLSLWNRQLPNPGLVFGSSGGVFCPMGQSVLPIRRGSHGSIGIPFLRNSVRSFRVSARILSSR